MPPKPILPIPPLPERRPAAHVQAAVARAVQPKPAGAPSPGRPVAPHVQKALAAIQPKRPTPQPVTRALAPHVQAALSGGAQAKTDSMPPRAPQRAPHVQAAVVQAKAVRAPGVLPAIVQRSSEAVESITIETTTSSVPQKVLKAREALEPMGILEDEQIMRWRHFLKGKLPAENKVKGLVAEYLAKGYAEKALSSTANLVTLTGVKVAAPSEEGWVDLAELDTVVGTVTEDEKFRPLAIVEAKAGKYGPGKYAQDLKAKQKQLALALSGQALLTQDTPLAELLEQAEEEERDFNIEDFRNRKILPLDKKTNIKEVALWSAGPQGKSIPIEPEEIAQVYGLVMTVLEYELGV